MCNDSPMDHLLNEIIETHPIVIPEEGFTTEAVRGGAQVQVIFMGGAGAGSGLLLKGSKTGTFRLLTVLSDQRGKAVGMGDMYFTASTVAAVVVPSMQTAQPTPSNNNHSNLIIPR